MAKKLDFAISHKDLKKELSFLHYGDTVLIPGEVNDGKTVPAIVHQINTYTMSFRLPNDLIVNLQNIDCLHVEVISQSDFESYSQEMQMQDFLEAIEKAEKFKQNETGEP